MNVHQALLEDISAFSYHKLELDLIAGCLENIYTTSTSNFEVKSLFFSLSYLDTKLDGAI